MTVRILAFARVRELLGTAETTLELANGARAGDAWKALTDRNPALLSLERSTRLARNGRIVERTELLAQGDELALLPPSGGG